MYATTAACNVGRAHTGSIHMTIDDGHLHAHQEMWQNFVRLLGYSAAAILILLALMATFLA